MIYWSNGTFHHLVPYYKFSYLWKKPKLHVEKLGEKNCYSKTQMVEQSSINAITHLPAMKKSQVVR
jgi:hypothetical protein